ncbi:hypothetical protein [Sulfurirhabdus autotrophica]|uniref:Transglycosylase SLT domain-containing protein n=1 Tax=Sulfurirhabdus autotrophica TaxID=1706046 RepID=A0A4R3XSX5_9PROT|nr:hypothetical protein [Sulfurirhabdus autotrophica]TCV81083.1 hypothetical protein EDC63_1261 [Sulfurirhabdus autotrophica]
MNLKPIIEKPAGALAGLSRIHGDAAPLVQDKIIDILVEIGARYKLSYRDIAHLLLICKIESGFNPDAAAGTSSAGGLGQYTKVTVKEAAKSNVSKLRLGFNLDLSGDYIFDAEHGAYGVVLSFMIAKEHAIEFFAKDYEKHLYLFHHEGWYFKPTKEHMEKTRPQDVLKIIDKNIIPHLDALENLLSKKTEVSFKLLTKDEKPYPDQPYVAIFPSSSPSKHKPGIVQGNTKKDAEFIFGKTDSEGKTQVLKTNGLAEILFIILNKDYKKLPDYKASSASLIRHRG